MRLVVITRRHRSDTNVDPDMLVAALEDVDNLDVTDTITHHVAAITGRDDINVTHHNSGVQSDGSFIQVFLYSIGTGSRRVDGTYAYLVHYANLNEFKAPITVPSEPVLQ